jgi:hypothetical protein
MRATYVVTLAFLANAGVAVHAQAAQSIPAGDTAALRRAIVSVRALPPGAARKIVLRGGVYPLQEPLELTALDSGLTIEAAPGETALLTGGRRIEGWRREAAGPLWSAELPSDHGREWRFRMLVVAGRIAPVARLPKEGFFHDADPDFVPGRETAAPERLTSLRYRGNDLEFGLDVASAAVRVYRTWDESMSRIVAVDKGAKTVRLESALRFPPGAMRRHDYEILNVREGLLTPGQWFLDYGRNRVFYWPLPGQDMQRIEALAPVPMRLIRIEGTRQRPVRDITLRNLDLTLAGAPVKSGGFAGSDLDGAISVAAGDGIELSGLRITQTGGAGIRAMDTSRLRVLGSVFEETGGCAIVINGGGENEVADNRVSTTGHLTPAAGGIHLRGDMNRVQHNEVAYTPYSGILVFGRGAVVEFNLVHHVMRTMADGAAYYTNGTGGMVRRNWAYEVGAGPHSQAPAYYLDDMTSGYRVEENAAVVTGWTLSVHAARDNVVTGNTFVASGDQRVEMHESARTVIEKNVFYADGRIRLGTQAGAVSSFKDNVVFSRAGVLEEMRWDENERVVPFNASGNLTADPALLNPAARDLRFRANSSALKLRIPVAPSIGECGPRHGFRR